MMRFALGEKCGSDKMPLNGFSGFAAAAANASRSNKLNSAAPPSPSANRPKNSRRFISKLMWPQLMDLSKLVQLRPIVHSLPNLNHNPDRTGLKNQPG